MPLTDAEFKKLKVTDLKELLKEAGLPVSGKKDDLIARLIEHRDAAATAEEPPAVQEEQDAEMETATTSEVTLPTPSVEPTPAPVEAEPVAAEVQPEPVPVRAKEVHEREEDVEEPSRASKRVKVDEPQQEVPAVEVATEVLVVEAGGLVQVPEPVEDVPLAQKPVKVAEPEQDMAVKEEATELPTVGVVQVMEPVEVKEDVKEEIEDEEPPEYHFEPEPMDLRPSDMYLDTVNRSALDFDFERLCSVTLSHNNIYACLTDGKYFQGRGKNSPAYAHSIAEDKHVYINLTTHKVYVLPDGYEVTDPSLDDIKYLLFPTFTPALLTSIDRSITPSFALAHTPYYPGFVGLNNIKSNSYANSILHSLVHVIPLRDYFILNPLVSAPGATELVKRFSMLCRKVWNPKAFKGQVSPHELLQECASRSGNRFKITEAADPLDFLGWFLNTLHKDLGGSKKPKSSIIYSAFQGEIRVDDQQVVTTGEFGSKPRFDIGRDVKSIRSPFLFLAIDLPPPPLFQDSIEKNIIPQVPISAVLAKYDGVTTQETAGLLRRYKITRLPPFLILHIKRFEKNVHVATKNPTIVNFPLRGVDMADYVDPQSDVAQYYDLVSNITHSSTAETAAEETAWRTQVHLRPPRDASGRLEEGLNEEDEKWFVIQDLIVEEINRGMISIAESYIQIWERRSPMGHALVVDPPRPKKSTL